MVLARCFQNFKLRRLARLYAACLPALLVRDYGAGETYNDSQITASVRRAKLPRAGLRIARAAYLPEAEFVQKYGADYARLHRLFKDSLPSVVSTGEQICGTTDSTQVPIGWSP